MCVYTHAGKTDVLGTEAGQQHTRPEEARDLVGVSLSKLRVLVTDREAQHGAVHGVAKSRTRLSD